MGNKKFTCFKRPTQVMFFNGTEFKAGIAYQTDIICSCCGSVNTIEQIYDAFDQLSAKERERFSASEAIWDMPWVDFNDEIKDDYEEDS